MEWVADYNRQWTYLMQAALAVGCAFPVRRMIGALPALTLFWFLAGGVATWQNSFGTYDHLDQTTLLAVEAFALDSAVKLVLVVGVMLWLSRLPEVDLFGKAAILVFIIANALAVLAQFAVSDDYCHSNMCGGLVGNPSMSGSLMVVALPLFGSLPLGILVGAAVLATRASSPMGLLAIALALSLHKRLIPPMLIGIFGFGYAFLGDELLNSGDRLEMWQQFLKGWNNPTNWAFGIGLGEFGVAAAVLQFVRDVKTNSWWLWAHNDWLQSVIEGGAVGAGLLFASWVQAMRKAAKPVAASLFLYGLMMLTNYPMHLATTAVLGCWLMVLALRKADGEMV